MANLAYNDFKEQQRREMLDGVIRFMAPGASTEHNRTNLNIAAIFNRHLKGKHCRAFGDGNFVYLTEKDIVIPDAFIVCNRDIIKSDGIFGTPDLIVEVLSRSTSRNDRGYKKDLYERCGVKEYWLVETTERRIEVYLLEEGKYVLDNVYYLLSDNVKKLMTEEEKAALVYEFKTSLFDDLIIDVREVFEDVEI
jgi:Uma2 family endonuclease